MSQEKSSSFSVIRGGLAETTAQAKKTFVSAYVTDTRLMGVVGVYIHWALPENQTRTDLHQFFYFDAEEFGFDTYVGVVTSPDGEGLEMLYRTEYSLLGGLGGKQVKLTQQEARYLIQQYVEMNRRLHLPLPEGYDEYSFLLSPQIQLPQTESYVLMSKQCPVLSSPYQVINYFLMRIFGKDFEAAKFLTKHYVRTDLFPEHGMATLFKNTIDEADSADSGTNTAYHVTGEDSFSTHTAYLCESLIAYDDLYYIIVTQVTLDHLRVVKFEKISSFKVSGAEAAMMLAKPEYITVFDIIDGAPSFNNQTTKLSRRAMPSSHEIGEMYMIFYPHNNHVNQPVFALNEDVLGVYFVTEYGQLILSAFSTEGIKALESDFLTSGYAHYCILVSKYEFKEPVLYDFLSSGFEDFEDFVDFIAAENTPDLDPDD